MACSNSSGKAFWGYAAGLIAGVTYGMNPLFAKPLLTRGVSVDTMLFFRYLFAFLLLGGWIALHRERFRISRKQFSRLLILGLLFGCSSLFLFLSYNYIPAGLATTLVYLYPVLVAILMISLRVYPTWQVWLSILLTLVGVVLLCRPAAGETFRWQGIVLAASSALSYAMYLVIVNRSTSIRGVSNNVLTFYVLVVGSTLFLVHHLLMGGALWNGVKGWQSWLDVTGLAVFPTLLSLVCLAAATRRIGATKTSVLGVFEPVTAILIGTAVFREPLTTNIVVGVVISLFAILFMILTSAARKRQT